MSYALQVIQPLPMQKCNRGGACCKVISLQQSPKTLREMYQRAYRTKVGASPDEEWDKLCLNHKLVVESAKLEPHEDILLIYPMLEGRCRGKTSFFYQDRGDGQYDLQVGETEREYAIDRYIYGPCANLKKLKDGLVGCAIHDNKPLMCARYPWSVGYFQNKGNDVYHSTSGDNPALMRGCGYNLNPNVGVSEAEILSALIPLDDDDK